MSIQPTCRTLRNGLHWIYTASESRKWQLQLQWQLKRAAMQIFNIALLQPVVWTLHFPYPQMNCVILERVCVLCSQVFCLQLKCRAVCCYRMTKLACWPRVRLALSITCVRQRPNSVMIRSSCSMSDRRDCSPSSASATRHEHIASITSSVRKLYAGLTTGQHTHSDNNSKMWQHDAQNTARRTITLSRGAVSPQRYVNWISTLCHGNRLAQLVEQQTCNPSWGSTTQWPWASHSHLCVCVIKHYNSLTATMPWGWNGNNGPGGK